MNSEGARKQYGTFFSFSLNRITIFTSLAGPLPAIGAAAWLLIHSFSTISQNYHTHPGSSASIP